MKQQQTNTATTSNKADRIIQDWTGLKWTGLEHSGAQVTGAERSPRARVRIRVCPSGRSGADARDW